MMQDIIPGDTVYIKVAEYVEQIIGQCLDAAFKEIDKVLSKKKQAKEK